METEQKWLNRNTILDQGKPRQSPSVLTGRRQGNAFLAVLKEDSASSVSEEEEDKKKKPMKYRYPLWMLHCLLGCNSGFGKAARTQAVSRLGSSEALQSSVGTHQS